MTDTRFFSASDTVTITVEAPAATLEADAGEDSELRSGATVTLDGSGSMPGQGRTIATHAWTRTSGTGGSLTDADEAMARFTAPALTPGAPDATHVFELTVTDDKGSTDTDTVTITVVNAPPVANAGVDQNVTPGAQVTLDGSGSRDDDGTITYAWTRKSGSGDPTVMLSDTTAIKPTFTADMRDPGSTNVFHTFELTVTDDDGATDTDTVRIVILSPFVPLTANAGDDQSVTSGATVELDGSASEVDPRVGIGAYRWVRTGGTTGANVTLSDARVAKPTFTADTLTPGAEDVTHIFTLTVADNADNTSTDTVRVTVVAPDPTDMVAPTGVFREVSATHDGETPFEVEVKFSEPVIGLATGNFGGSYFLGAPEGTPGPEFTNLAQDPNDPTLYTITVTPRFPGSFFLVLTTTGEGGVVLISDAGGNALGSFIGSPITYVVPPTPPVADAGPDQTVFSGATVRLDGIGTSDIDDLIETWLWERIDGTSTSTADVMIINKDKQQASFVAETLTAGSPDVTHVIRLTVTDEAGHTDYDEVTITVREPFAAPVADAGEDQLEVAPGATVQLDGSGSSVDRRRTATYNWERTSGTTGGSVTLSPSATVQNPTFTADALVAGDSDVTHEFTLTVMDNDGGAPATDMVTITVTAPAAPRVAAAGDDQTVAAGATVTLDGSGSTVVNGPISAYNWTRESGTSTRTTIFATDSGGTTNQREISTPTITFVADNVPANGAAVTHVIALRVF